MQLNIHKPNLLSFVLIGLTWICCIIGFASYWWSITVEMTENSEPTTTTMLLKYNEQKVSFKSGNQDIEGTQSVKETDANKNQLAILKVCLAFSVLAFVVLTGCMVLIVAHFLNALKSTRFPFSILGRVLPFVALLFCLVSMLVFLAFPNAMKRDCENQSSNNNNNSGDINFGCESDMTKKFIGSISAAGTEIKWAPTTSWAAMVVACGLIFGGSIFNFIFGNYEESTPH
ncbi:hypothetical protein PPL_09458 [Heterostelium album PN500]|uniref:Transmembrane protein n=1 Tax=Heterostelium pallidum (strain ATCC 26659 / Pp 5 / PN500) TaxID=670386 RepID=D3BPI9_HETP5|nr:hypothetical protein PPL_09458 [Heterostelium album PN500]EFA76707.1 hypothetical protein PPL_09458 [Heterostelium album PN500]|eukprot:XP_020428839.1 hypothetical protein PPL_09458 [Heterostelium album PN500]